MKHLEDLDHDGDDAPEEQKPVPVKDGDEGSHVQQHQHNEEDMYEEAMELNNKQFGEESVHSAPLDDES